MPRTLIKPLAVEPIVQEKPRHALRRVLAAFSLLAVLLAAYSPALHGEVLWDDEAHLTKPELQNSHGLWRIWTDLKATQQYYPMVHSAFWVQHQLWSDNTLGCHVVNIVLHWISACLLYVILRRLKIPGAWIAWLLFALHPIYVESVAWMTELKNTQSGVFYFAAALIYLRFDETRRYRLYALGLVLFVLGLLSKSVIATLPAALLVVFWWQRGRLSLKRDILPLIPWLLIGAASGLFTAYIEHETIGAKGPDFALSAAQRLLVAGRVPWFYLSKIIFPAPLSFIYPRWNVDPFIFWQFVYPLATIAAFIALWKRRKQSRAPLAAALFFVGSLFPVLGFFNVYPFLFSYVADHFQYIASVGVIVLLSAGMAIALSRMPETRQWLGKAAVLVVVAALGVQTWRQSRMYSKLEDLYRATLERSPECWLALSNLGNILRNRGDMTEAKALYEHSLAIRPQAPLTLNSLGVLYLQTRNVPLAKDCFRRAIAAQEEFPLPHSNLGVIYLEEGNPAGALQEFQRLVEIVPDSGDAHSFLSQALFANKSPDDAVKEMKTALALKGEFPEAYNLMGLGLFQNGLVADSIEPFELAMQRKPKYTNAAFNLARAYAALGRFEDAVRVAEQARQWASEQGNAVQVNVLDRRIAEYRSKIAPR